MEKEDINTRLDKFPKENIHKVPEDFFEKLPVVIQIRINAGKVEKNLWSGKLAYKILIPAISMICLYFVFVNQFIPDNNAENKLSANNSIADGARIDKFKPVAAQGKKPTIIDSDTHSTKTKFVMRKNQAPDSQISAETLLADVKESDIRSYLQVEEDNDFDEVNFEL